MYTTGWSVYKGWPNCIPHGYHDQLLAHTCNNYHLLYLQLVAVL